MSKNKKQLISENRHDFESLISIMDILRSDKGCPWDREQTHQSIRKCLIEETYEVVEAIDNDNILLLKEELGDLLFQTVFHSKIEDEAGNFSIYDVIHDICEKMIKRHPHVFQDQGTKDVITIQQTWDDIKVKEKNLNSVLDSFNNIPPYLPSLLKAQKVHKKARSKFSLGFCTKVEALEYALNKIRDNSISEAIFALSAAAEFDDIDIEMELDNCVKSFVESCKSKI